MKTIALIPVLVLLGFQSAQAVTNTSCDVRGQVRTVEGQPVRAIVRWTDDRTGQSRVQQANERGRFHFIGVRPDGDGHQRIEVTAPGFEPQSRSGVPCPLGNLMRADITLERH